MKAWRIILAAAGIALGAFGVFRLLTELPTYSLLILGVWLLAALVIQDAILAPSVVGVGWLLRPVRPRSGAAVSPGNVDHERAHHCDCRPDDLPPRHPASGQGSPAA